MSKITVIDGIMGSGKTTLAMQMMQNQPLTKRYVFVTPFLDETQRIKEGVPARNFKLPDASAEDSKIDQLKAMLANGEDVAITHALFTHFDADVFEILQLGGYTLVLDEVMNVISDVPVGKGDVKFLLRHNVITINEITRQVQWLDREYETDTKRFKDIKRFADSGNLYAYRDQFMLWQLPVQLFSYFDEVFILTYLFEAQMQAYYYKFHGIEYTLKTVTNFNGIYGLTDAGTETQRILELERRKKIGELLNVYEGKLNDIGKHKTALSSTQLRALDKQKQTTLRNNLYNFFRHTCNAKKDDVIWTTIKDAKDKLAARGYKGEECFLPVNARATNKKAHTRAVAYVYNRFMKPTERAFFETAGIKVNEDMLALSDMLQWVWRSRIRDNKQIDVYVPSKRMRDLLTAWIKGDI